MVVRRDMTSRDAGDQCVTAELDVLHGLESECRVAEKDVDAKKTDEGEVAEIAVEWPGPVLAGDCTIPVSGDAFMGENRLTQPPLGSCLPFQP